MQNFIKITSVVNYLHRIALLRSPNCRSARDGFLTGLPFFLLLVVVLSPCDGFAQGEPERGMVDPCCFRFFQQWGAKAALSRRRLRVSSLTALLYGMVRWRWIQGRILDVEEVRTQLNNE
jgi:hypothetical protein